MLNRRVLWQQTSNTENWTLEPQILFDHSNVTSSVQQVYKYWINLHMIHAIVLTFELFPTETVAIQ